MNKNIIFVDMNPVSEQIPIYQIGICFLGGIAIERGWKVNVIEYYELKARGIFSFKKDFDEADCICISIRNIDNTEGSNPISYLETINDDMQYLSKEYVDKSILGGAGFSILPYEILGIFQFKYGIVGRSGKLFKEMLEHLECKMLLQDFFPQHIRKNEDLCDIYCYEKLNSIWSIMPYIEDERKILGFDTHIGCNGQCIYCTYPQITAGQNSQREMSEIREFILEAEKKGLLNLQIVDDVFNSNLEYAKNVCREIAKVKHNIKISCYLSPYIDLSFAELLKKAGVHEVIMGIDSLSNDILVNMKKGFTEEQIYRARKMLEDVGINVVYTFIIGSAFETISTLRETEKLILKHMPDKVTLQYGMRVYPGTVLAESIRPHIEEFWSPIFIYSDELPKEIVMQTIKKIKEIFTERKML